MARKKKRDPASTVGGIAIRASKKKRTSRTTAPSVAVDIRQQKNDPGLSEFLPPPIRKKKKRK